MGHPLLYICGCFHLKRFRTMTKKEIDEFFRLLRTSGVDIELCDMYVPYFADGVPAGYPEAPGDYDGEMVPMPRSFLKMCDFILAVHGDSMKDAGILNGDDVIVKHDVRFEDGDVVVAWLDGETSLKSYYKDDEGEVWLMPANDAFNPIRVSDYTTVYILGKVTKVTKKTPRLSYSAMRRRLQKMHEEQRREVTDDMVRDVLTQVLTDIKVGRMWFCVYRVLADVGYLHKGGYDMLKERMDELYPDNDFNISVREVSRMDVGSFSKPVSRWDKEDAPVTGKRFNEYHTLATNLTNLLNEARG